MEVEVAWYPCAGRPPQVGAQVEAFRAVGGLDGPHSLHDAFPYGRPLSCLELFDSADMTGGQDHEMAAGIGVGVENGGGQAARMAPDDERFLVGPAAGEDGAEDTVVAVRGG